MLSSLNNWKKNYLEKVNMAHAIAKFTNKKS